MVLLAARPDLRQMIESEGPSKFFARFRTLLNEGKLKPDQVDYRELAEACGVLNQMRGISALMPEHHVERLLSESGSGPMTALFAVAVGELVGRLVIEGYESDEGWIGDDLVTVQPMSSRGQRLAGFTAPGEGVVTAEGKDYDEATFEEKFVTSKEDKVGRVLSITEELLGFGMSGEINRRARGTGHGVRQTKERTIVRAVIDADGAANRIYRPSGVATELYKTTGANRNWIGVGNTTSTSYNAARELTGHEDIDHVLAYRATQVVDDRTDGSPRPIVSRVRQLLTSEKYSATGKQIVGATEVEETSGTGTRKFRNPHSMLKHLSSPFIDEAGGQHVNDWYLGDFRKQFVWAELWPVQTFIQRGQDTDSGFRADIVLRLKVRYYGGVSCVDTAHVTKVDGA